MDLTITVSEKAERFLSQRATAYGKDVKTLIEEIVETQAKQMTLDEILAPFRRSVEESGISDDELDALVEQAREEIYQEKLAKEHERN